ncbi:unnamed protein product [Caenorhabditis auriculariae]|uniref:Galectin n=1 Tax=Caenorhabditis auriculariae TaxID=2777116 RepID=A0A8S1H1E0_9PELO|nr:unnamed protein product [Caenorhabditis auriculariae]
MKFLLAFIGLLPLTSAIGIICKPWDNKTESRQVFSLETPLKGGDTIFLDATASESKSITHFIFDLYEGTPLATDASKNASLRIIANLNTSMMAFNTNTPDGKYNEEPKLSTIKRGGPIKIKILVRQIDYQIFVDDKLFWTYNFRRPLLKTVKAIGIEGIKFTSTTENSCPAHSTREILDDFQTIVIEGGKVNILYGPTLQDIPFVDNSGGAPHNGRVVIEF